MKLLVFINSLGGGGAERVAANLANQWARAGWNVTLITVANESDDFYALDPAVHRLGLGLGQPGNERFLGGFRRALRRTLRLRRELKRFQPDVALSFMHTNNVTLACAALGLPRIVTVGSEQIHPPSVPVGWTWASLRQHTYAWLTAIVALTGESAAWLRSYTRAPRVRVIPSPAVWPLPVQRPFVVPGERIPAGQRLLLAVGRLVGQKQFDHLVEAFALLAKTNPDWVLAILGEGPLRQALESQIRSRGLSDRVFLIGQVGNVGDWYERADLYVMTSRYEGFPNSLVEAMTHGVAAVSYDCDTGPRDLVHHNVDGLLVPSGDMGCLVRSLDSLMGDDELREEFSSRAMETRERLSMGRVAAMWEELFQELRKDRA